MRYLYKQTGIEVESDKVLDSTMFKLIIEEKTVDLIEDGENVEEPVEEPKEPTEDSEIPDTEEPVEPKKEASAKNTRKRTSTTKK